MTKKHNGEVTETSLIEFPCDFTLKIMGKNNTHFKKNVLAIIHDFFKETDEKNVSERLSKDSNYLSLSVTVFAENKTQLDTVYQALSECDDVLMTL